jgi:hypothetical protein
MTAQDKIKDLIKREIKSYWDFAADTNKSLFSRALHSHSAETLMALLEQIKYLRIDDLEKKSNKKKKRKKPKDKCILRF